MAALARALEGRGRASHRGEERLRGRAGGVRGAGDGEDGAGDGTLGDGAQRDAGVATRQHQVGQQRHGEAAGDEREADVRVARPVADVRLEAAQLAAGALGPAGCGAVRSSGILLCRGSGVAFGAMAVFGKLAFGAGATVGTLLSVRFVLAAALFWAVLGAREVRTLAGREVAAALGLGAGGYALQTGCYFAALERLDASLLSLLIYTFPAIVAVAASALGRERLDGRRAAALALTSVGLVLVVAGAGTDALDRRDQPALCRPAARRADDRLDSRHGRAARHGAARVRRLRRAARRRG